ncbi:hypothetical protein VroAM7_02460 [Vibrio rotiferianus]|uniref:O-antigen ligase-related domain-containing protein n=2 Tax=Vibrio rotiferianus TaxID=190895 RepID=A0A510I1W4_9VIBR|nr:hypothetical protein VroAM7_02460 [Vibrio rotiferianus]
MLSSLFFILFCLVSVFYGVIFHSFDIEISLQSLVRYSFMLLLVPLISNVYINDESKLKEYFNYLAFGMAVSVVVNFVGVYFSWPSFWGTGRAHGFYGNANWFGYMMVFSLYSFYYLSTQNKIFMLVCFPLTILAIYNIILSGSNSALFAVIVLMVWIFISGLSIRKVIAFSLLLLVMPTFLVLISNSDYFSEFRGATRFLNFFSVIFGDTPDGVSSLGSISERFELILASIEVYVDYSGFLIGYGLSQTPVLFQSLGYHEASVHVNLISILIEVGLLGLLMYGVWLAFGYINFSESTLSRLNKKYIKGNLILFVFIGLFTPHVYLGFFFAFILPVWGRYEKLNWSSNGLSCHN